MNLDDDWGYPYDLGNLHMRRLARMMPHHHTAGLVLNDSYKSNEPINIDQLSLDPQGAHC